MTLTETALEKAHAILSSECSPIGLMASPEGYPHVWARDSVITSLGAILSPGHENCLRVSLETLVGQQSELGAIPNNVSVATGRLDHTNAGSVDSNLWYILGHYIQQRAFGDADFLRQSWPSLERALVWLRYQDRAAQVLEKLAEVNRQGVDAEWEFNEWCHGATGRPMGYPHQAWSAGMYVFAHRCVQAGRVPIFDETWNGAERKMAC